MLKKQPGFTLISALTLAIGIGANTAIFSVINGVLLRSLAFHEPDRLYMLWADIPTSPLGIPEAPVTNADLPEWRASATSFEQLAAFQSNHADLSDGGDPERVGGVDVTVNLLPLSGNEMMNFIAIEGAEPAPRGKEQLAEDRVITPGYLGAVGMSLMSGRDFDATDGVGKPPVAIVNETLARWFFPSGDAIGKRIKWEYEDWRTIVGVVRDVRSQALERQALPQLYVPYAQSHHKHFEMTLAIRAGVAALPTLRSAIQRELKQLDAIVPVANYRTLPELLSETTVRPRFITLLLGLFAAAALMLTVIGLYGVVAYGVNQRTREIGIRMALGAQRQNILALVTGQGMRPAFVGVGVGMAGAFALTRLLAGQLYEIKPTDPATFGIVALGLVFVSLAACYIPARRAAKIDPMAALRND
jgi:putative ABC transport system permease protein